MDASELAINSASPPALLGEEEEAAAFELLCTVRDSRKGMKLDEVQVGQEAPAKSKLEGRAMENWPV